MKMKALSLAVTTLATVAVTVPAGVAATDAGDTGFTGAKVYRNCAALNRDFKHGVSKSRAAARYQVRQGYGMPAYGSRAVKIYWANYRQRDADRDGTACEN